MLAMEVLENETPSSQCNIGPFLNKGCAEMLNGLLFPYLCCRIGCFIDCVALNIAVNCGDIMV